MAPAVPCIRHANSSGCIIDGRYLPLATKFMLLSEKSSRGHAFDPFTSFFLDISNTPPCTHAHVSGFIDNAGFPKSLWTVSFPHWSQTPVFDASTPRLLALPKQYFCSPIHIKTMAVEDKLRTSGEIPRTESPGLPTVEKPSQPPPRAAFHPAVYVT